MQILLPSVTKPFMSVICLSVSPWHPGLLFVGKAWSLPYTGVCERCLTRISFDYTRKHYTNLERLARDKHSSLLLVNHREKKFYKTGPWNGIHSLDLSLMHGSLTEREGSVRLTSLY
jgi:hypothetical protein